jgi:hypothetical protein
VLSGPWLTSLVARGIARFSRRAPTLLAARRLQDNPAAAFRAISGVTLAVFVGTVFSGLAASILAAPGVGDSDLAPGVVAAVPRADSAVPPSVPNEDVTEAPPAASLPGSAAIPRFPELDPARTAELVDELAAVPGVRDVVEIYAVPDDPALVDALLRSGTGATDTPVLVSCADAVALGVGACPAGGEGDRAGGGVDGGDGGVGSGHVSGAGDGRGATVVNVGPDRVDPTGVVSPMSARELAGMPVVTVAAVTDGSTNAVERARTRLELGIPGAPALTGPDIDAEGMREFRTLQRVSDVGLSMTLVIAGCSLAVAVAGAIVERRQPFALLRLTGTRLSDLRRIVLAEAAAPLLMVAAASVALGLVVAALVLATGSTDTRPFVLPGLGYWLSLVGGLALALLVVLATMPLLNRLTTLDSARFE